MKFYPGDVVETTGIYTEKEITGIVESVNEEYADVKVDNGVIISIGLQWLQRPELKFGDKAETTPKHHERFGFNRRGLIDDVDGDYVNLWMKGVGLLTVHRNWLNPFDGDLLILHKGKFL